MTLYPNSSPIYIKLYHSLSHLTYQKWREKKEKGKKEDTKNIYAPQRQKTKAQQVTENGDETIAHRLSLARPRGNMAARERRWFSFAATKRR